MKCEYFLQSIPNHPPPRASKWGHRKHSQVRTTVILDLKIHLYTHCDLAALLLHLEKIMFEMAILALGPLFWGTPWGPDAPVKQITCPLSHE